MWIVDSSWSKTPRQPHVKHSAFLWWLRAPHRAHSLTSFSLTVFLDPPGCPNKLIVLFLSRNPFLGRRFPRVRPSIDLYPDCDVAYRRSAQSRQGSLKPLLHHNYGQ